MRTKGNQTWPNHFADMQIKLISMTIAFCHLHILHFDINQAAQLELGGRQEQSHLTMGKVRKKASFNVSWGCNSSARKIFLCSCAAVNVGMVTGTNSFAFGLRRSYFTRIRISKGEATSAPPTLLTCALTSLAATPSRYRVAAGCCMSIPTTLATSTSSAMGTTLITSSGWASMTASSHAALSKM